MDMASFCVGLCHYFSVGNGPLETLMKRADAALKDAKNHGRNQVAVNT